MSNYENMTVQDLRKIAVEHGVKGISLMKKEELIDAIKGTGTEDVRGSGENSQGKTEVGPDSSSEPHGDEGSDGSQGGAPEDQAPEDQGDDEDAFDHLTGPTDILDVLGPTADAVIAGLKKAIQAKAEDVPVIEDKDLEVVIDQLCSTAQALMDRRMREGAADKVPLNDLDPSELLRNALYNAQSIEPYLSTGQTEKAQDQAGDALNYLMAYIIAMEVTSG